MKQGSNKGCESCFDQKPCTLDHPATTASFCITEMMSELVYKIVFKTSKGYIEGCSCIHSDEIMFIVAKPV